MRIVILTVDHPYANRVVKELIKEFGKEINLIVESGVLYPGKTLLQGLKKYILTSGIYYVMAQAIKLELYRVLAKVVSLFPNKVDNKFFSFKKSAKKHSIETVEIINVNGESFRHFLQTKKPDLLVSVFFNQIIKPETIKIPRKGVINIHPAYLPDYKGVSPVFWALANGEKEAGVSVHYIDEGIDTGGIIKREKIKIKEGDTEDLLYSRCIDKGIPLLLQVIKEIERGKTRTIPNKGGRYFSLPSKRAVKEIKRRGSGFFNIREFLFSS